MEPRTARKCVLAAAVALTPPPDDHEAKREGGKESEMFKQANSVSRSVGRRTRGRRLFQDFDDNGGGGCGRAQATAGAGGAAPGGGGGSREGVLGGKARKMMLLLSLTPKSLPACLQGSAKRWDRRWMNFVPALAFHLCLALPTAFTQPGDRLQPNFILLSNLNHPRLPY